MKKIFLNLVLSSVILHSSAQRIIKIEKVTDHSIHVIGNNFEGVIFSRAFITTYPHDYKDTVKRIQFSPSNEDVIKAEQILQSEWNKLYYKSGSAWNINLKKSFRQYFGFTDKNGDRIIYVNGLPKHMDGIDTEKMLYNGVRIRRYYNEEIEVSDGGPDFWQIGIDLKLNKIVLYMVNGVA